MKQKIEFQHHQHKYYSQNQFWREISPTLFLPPTLSKEQSPKNIYLRIIFDLFLSRNGTSTEYVP